jgi:ribose/xylose/arabinose/galactoside ABC-type transport system permease subunit
MKLPTINRILNIKLLPQVSLLALVIIYFTFASPNRSYISIFNIRNILDSMVLFIPITVGATMLIIFGEMDFSAGYVGTVSGILMAYLLRSTEMPWLIAVLLGFAVGIAFGLFNGVLINEFGFQSFIATLTTGTFIVRGLIFVITNNVPIPIENPVIVFVGTYRIGGLVPVSIIISLLVVLIYGVLLSKTKFGRSIYLCGGNRRAAKLSGISPKKISYILFANSGFLGALAGVLFVGRMRSTNVSGINDYVFSAITAVLVGGVSFGGGSGGILGCFIGLMIINGFSNGLTVLGISPFWRSVASGLLLFVALTFDYLSKRGKMRSVTQKVISTIKKEGA